MPWFDLVNCRTWGWSAMSARQAHSFINCTGGSQSVVCVSSPAPSCLSICAGSKHTPVPTVHWCSVAGPLKHLPITGGGNTTAGIGSPKVASGPLLSKVLGLLPLEIWKCHIFSCGSRKVFPPLDSDNVNYIKSFLSQVFCIGAFALCVSMFALGFSCFARAHFLVKVTARSCWSKEETWGPAMARAIGRCCPPVLEPHFPYLTGFGY